MPQKHTIKINIKGPNVAPETVGMGDLADFGRHIEDAIKIAIQGGDSPLANYDEAVISLVGVRKGESSDLEFALSLPALPAYGAISEALASGNYSGIPGGSQEELSCISKQAIRKDWAIEIVSDDRLSIRGAVISKNNPVPPPSPAIIAGSTTIYGYLIRVGGRVPKAVIRFPDDKKLSVDITKSIAKDLGKRLYEDVGLEGVARWRIRDWEMLDFRATRITEYQPQSTDLIRTFEDLANATGGRWNNIDVDQFVDDLRSDKSGDELQTEDDS